MFNLEQSIVEWRKQMLAAGIQTPVPLEELEIHLRDEIERQMRFGLNEQNAFETATGQIGRAEMLKKEFVKAGIPIHEQLKRSIFTLAGIPNHQLATTMNTNLSLEPRWATYAKGGVFAFPAIFLWLFTVIFVLPKANEICHAAGVTVFGFDTAPAFFKILGFVGPLLIFLSHHWFLSGGVILLAVVLVERFSNRWPRYRRVAIGAGVFLANACVLLALALMIISILIAAPAMSHAH